jgi:hypothetical protein
MNDFQDDPTASAVRRHVGIHALRRLRQLVDADQAAERARLVWARRLAWFFVGLAAVAVLVVFIR